MGLKGCPRHCLEPQVRKIANYYDVFQFFKHRKLGVEPEVDECLEPRLTPENGRL